MYFSACIFDVWCPYKKPTYDRKYYFVTIVDDYSRYTWGLFDTVQV